MADDHGWNDLGCYGNLVVRTPYLDRIAAEGVSFGRCFTTAPLCSPGRGAVMTGALPACQRRHAVGAGADGRLGLT